MNLPENLLIVVPFFYKEDNLIYLKKTSSHYNSLGRNVFLKVLTNTSNKSEIYKLSQILSDHKLKFSVYTPKLLGHPYLLPFSHIPLMKESLRQKFTHFMFIEDDILFTKKNMTYWIRERELLKKIGKFYPSFVRVEKNSLDKYVFSDINRRYYLFNLPKVKINNKIFININKPYQGMYLYDRLLMEEYINSEAINPDFGKAQIREKANLGLTFLNVPKKFYSRNLLMLDKNKIFSGCFVKHLRSNAKKRKLIGFFKKRLLDESGFTTRYGTIEQNYLFK